LRRGGGGAAGEGRGGRRARVRRLPALARGVPHGPRRPPRRALDVGRRRSPHVIGPEEAGPLGHPGVRTAGRYIPWVEQEPEAPLSVRDLLRVWPYERGWPVPERQRVPFERLQALELPLPRLQVRADA